MPSSSLLPASSAAAFCRYHRPFLVLSTSASSSFRSSSSSWPTLACSFSTRRCAHVFFLHFPRHRHVCRRTGYEFARPFHVTVAASATTQAVEDLPSKLADIVKLFQLVPEPRAKYEQLLHYGKKLKPVPKEFQTLENKVQGCVSQVWVRASIDEERRVYFEAESDSLLTKGLAALLVEGLSGAPAADILQISPDFIQMLGLNQSLTPSRSNGFLNMLKLMQKKTLQLAMEAEGTRVSNAAVSKVTSRNDESSVEKVIEVKEPMNGGGTSGLREAKTRQEIIKQKIETALDPVVLEVQDVSYQHAGHAGVERGASETHFNLKIVSPAFEGKTLVKRHRLVYDLLQEELQNGLHALSIVAKTPAEAEKHLAKDFCHSIMSSGWRHERLGFSVLLTGVGLLQLKDECCWTRRGGNWFLML
ncbi:hypothetical protein GOP47_0021907 [Adiantum capillus-veneris]|uniref:Fe-S metabolism associated domain-containing protein n=1 Tax=Adiantum capillus-veneris TaxID=13818 RepID=A0A9D4U901_ADICA|nr:hypothetical protein GOP47_0021907 [Adiantum capillus-veneris]